MISFQRTLYYLLFISSIFLISACTTTEIDQFRQASTSITADESIVILGRRQGNRYETRGEFIKCVGKVITSGDNPINVVPEQEFLDSLFPFFEPRTAPMRTEQLQQLMDHDGASHKIKEYGIEYIVWIDGVTQRSGEVGSMTCAAGPGGAGCFGFGTWVNDSNFEAEIWDLDTLISSGSISADANGQSYVPAVVIPIPLIARVEANACAGMGKQLKQFINGA